MKTIIRQANLSGSTHWFTWALAVLLLPLSGAVLASGKTQANPPEPAEVAAENRVAAAPTAQPEVWLCAGERIADLLRPDAEWPFVKQHLTGIKLERVRPGEAAQTRRQARPDAKAELRKARLIEDVAYGRDAPEAQVLNAHLIQSPQPSPVLVQIISGGWNSSPPPRAPAASIQPYLDAGISVVFVAHRSISDTVHWPAPADDLARAIQFIRAHASDWGIDPQRIAVKGRSSGGHVALMVGFGPDRAKPDSHDPVGRQASRPTCILAGSAPTDLAQQMSELLKSADRQEYLWERMRSLLGAGREEMTVEELTRRLKPLSPIEIVTQDAPPVLLMHPGPADAFWPGDARLKWDVHTPITGLILAKKLKELGVPHELLMIPEGQGRRDGGVALDHELAFLRRNLGVSNDPPPPSTEAAELAKFDRPQDHLPRSGAGGSEWDACYRSFTKAGLRGADFADAFTGAFACTAEAFEQDPDVRRRVRAASPLFLVTPDDPPGLIMHTASEEMTSGKHPSIPEVINDPHSAWHGALLADAMGEAGIEVICRIGPRVGQDLAADNETIVRFIHRCLKLEKNPPKLQR